MDLSASVWIYTDVFTFTVRQITVITMMEIGVRVGGEELGPSLFIVSFRKY